jgi:hypothetical protein
MTPVYHLELPQIRLIKATVCLCPFPVIGHPLPDHDPLR